MSPSLDGCVTYQCWPLSIPFSIVAAALCKGDGGGDLVGVSPSVPARTWVSLGLLLLSPVTARGQIVPKDNVTQLPWTRLDLRSGAVPWGCLCETRQTQRAVCAAVASPSTTWWLPTGLNGFWGLIIAPQVPPLEIWVNSLYPKCSVLSAWYELLPSFSACVPWGRAASSCVPWLSSYRVPAPLHSPYQNKKRKEKMFFLFPKETLSMQSHGKSMCTNTHMHRCERRKLSCISWSKHSHHVMCLIYN